MFSVLINDLDNGTGCTINKLPARLGEAIDTQDSWAATEMGIDRLEIWANRNLTKFKKRKWKVLPLWSDNLMHQHRLESGFAEDICGSWCTNC